MRLPSRPLRWALLLVLAVLFAAPSFAADPDLDVPRLNATLRALDADPALADRARLGEQVGGRAPRFQPRCSTDGLAGGDHRRIRGIGRLRHADGEREDKTDAKNSFR